MSDNECCCYDDFEELQVGRPAPGFTGEAVVGHDFAKVSYDNGELTIGDQTITGKWLVLFFYPLDFTFVCPTEITAISDRIAEFRKLGAEVIGCSVDSKFSHLAWKQQARDKGGLGEISFPILSDLGGEIASSYHVLLDDNVAARGIFVIDDKGVLQSYTVNNLGVGRNVDEVLRLIQAYQYVAEHGEVCPANWQPGGATMKPDPEGSQEYFGKVGK